MTVGSLVVLNGAPSAGKTVTARALLPLLAPGAVHTGLDHVLERLQPFGPEPRTAIDRIARAGRIITFQITDGYLRLMRDLHREVLTLVCQGHDVVLDTALHDPRVLRDAATRFATVHGLFVGMKPPLAISEQWERERGDRPQGQARRHYARVHEHGTYDLILDPSVLTPQECAVSIMRRLKNGPEPAAFERLARYQ